MQKADKVEINSVKDSVDLLSGEVSRVDSNWKIEAGKINQSVREVEESKASVSDFEQLADSFSMTAKKADLNAEGIAQLKVSSEEISGVVAKVEGEMVSQSQHKQLSDEVSWKVSRDDLFTDVTVEPDKFKVKSSMIVLSGDTRVEGDFKVSGSTIVGDLDATAIKIKNGNQNVLSINDTGELELNVSRVKIGTFDAATSKEVDGKINEIKDNLTHRVEVSSTNGLIFRNGDIVTVLEAKVYKGAEDITSQISESNFLWKKIISDGIEDINWNANKGIGVKRVTITASDFSESATFICEVIK